MNSLTLLPILGELLLKSALVLTVAFLVQAAWRGASAAQRHLVWCLAFGALLLLPATRLFEPRWALPIVTVRSELPAPALVPIAIAPRASVPAVATPVRSNWSRPSWQTVILVGWLGGALLLLGRRAAGRLRLRRFSGRCAALNDARAQRLLDSVRRELRIRRAIALRTSSQGTVPLTWGTLRPTLLLPPGALEWSDARLEAALRHEAGHIARADHLTRLVAQLACCVYWPNPLAWLAARALQVAQEQATDDLVLRGGTEPVDYATQLFDVAHAQASGGSGSFAVAMASPSTLERRLLAIVDETRSRRPVSRAAIAGGLAVVALLFGLSTAAQLRAEEKKTTGEAGTAISPKGPQVEIEAKFIEVTPSESTVPKSTLLGTLLRQDSAAGKSSQSSGVSGILTPQQFADTMTELNGWKGVDTLSAPRVTTFSGQQATIEIVREFRYPGDFEKKGQKWVPVRFQTNNVGVTFSIVATLEADGSLNLDLSPSVVDLAGFTDLETGKRLPPESENKAAGRRQTPIFSERKTKASITVSPEQTVALLVPRDAKSDLDSAKGKPARTLLVFVTAKVLSGASPAGSETPQAAAAAERPGKVEITSDSLSHDPTTGKVSAKGDVKIVTPDATIRAKEAEIEPTAKSTAVTAETLIIPKAEFRDATLVEATEYLQTAGRKAGLANLNIVLLGKPVSPENKITLSLTNVPLTEALRYLATLANLTIQRDGNRFTLESQAAGK